MAAFASRAVAHLLPMFVYSVRSQHISSLRYLAIFSAIIFGTGLFFYLLAPTLGLDNDQYDGGSIPEQFPHIIHQTWKSDVLPPLMRVYSQTWRTIHPDWEYRLWTDAEARAFVAESYPSFLPIYDGYPQVLTLLHFIPLYLLPHRMRR